ncbi:MAG: DUF4065 domain-containing protein [Coriobacteriaceae bacterium]|nr:DUF4065 domain-containing protein [Coriobacteriaceae bacterium]
MAKSIDVAAYILEKMGRLTTMKLQKLVYYSQARYMSLYRTVLFSDRIEAWANGPVVPMLFHEHSGKYMIGKGSLDYAKSDEGLSAIEKSVIDVVVDVLGDYSGEQLRELSHSELPWQEARKGYSVGARCCVEISPDSILWYYGSPECHNPVVA